MPDVTYTTALLLVPAATTGGTAELYRKDPGGGGLLAKALAAAGTWPVDQIVVVLGDDAETLLEDVSGVDVLIDPEWREGASAALRSGFDLVVRGDRADAVLVVSLDRPVPDADLVRRMLEAAPKTTRPIVGAKYRYALDYPFLVFPELWTRILGLEGDASLATLVASHPEWVAETWVDRVPLSRFESAADVGLRR